MNLGNKYNNLKWLVQKSFAVPSFIAIDQSQALKKEDRSGLSELVKNLKYPVAVRSSFNGEDSSGHSFAGLFDTILNVSDETQLIRAIQTVAVSLDSARVDSYCSHHNIEKPKWGSIVIQEMVQSKISGVIFTKNPMNAQQLIISCARGLGENLVSGLADSEDHLIDLKNPQFISGEILNENLQKELFISALKIEKLKNKSQDIEWAIDATNKIYFLQTRDITVQISQKNLPAENPIYFDNSNIQESFIGITSPLTFSYAKNAYRHTYNTLMKVMGFSSKEIAMHDWRHQHMLGLVDGRVYYNINSWYEGLLFLPHFGRHKKDMENMMGLETSIDFIQTQELSSLEKVKKLPKMLKLLVRLIFKFLIIKYEVKKFDEEFQVILNKHKQTHLSDNSLPELLNYLLNLQNAGFAMWGPPLVNDFYVMIYSGKVRRTLEKLNQPHLYPQLIKATDLESFKPILLLNEIVDQILKNQELLEIFRTDNEFLPNCQKVAPEIHRQIMQYIDMYGDRVLGELKLETETYRTRPTLFLETIKLFIDSKLNTNKIQPQNSTLNSDSVENLSLSFFSKIKFNSDLKKLQNGIRYRELMRFHRTRSFGMIREIYLEIAKKLTLNQTISESTDIFYLTNDEIAELITFQNVQNNIKDLITLRKNEYAEYFKSKKRYKNQIKMSFPLSESEKYEPTEVGTPQNSYFKGTGCYPGQLTAEICYVKNVTDAKNLSGKILLAERTDPGWTPLFYLAKAVIVEKGSILSHAAIVAREVGIPIIIGVPQITQKLKSGDRVSVNGSTGEIKIESAK